MSIPRKANVKCPECGNRYSVTVFESVNTDFSEHIAKSIIDATLFDAPCPKCGFIAHLEYDFLYHDMKHGAMVWVIHKGDFDYSKRVSEVRSTHITPYKVTRIVADIDSLREKVACLESGKDDHVVELCKVFLVYQLMKQQPDFKFKKAFYTHSGGKDIIYFYDTNGKEIHCFLEENIYKLIDEIFAQLLSQIQEPSYSIIDYSWALNVFDQLSDDADEAETSNEATQASDSADIEEAIVQQHVASKPINAPKQPVFCRRCGAKLLSDSLFCSYCGTKVITVE